MTVIQFLLNLLAIMGLIFIIGILANLIIDCVFIQPIMNREINKKKLELASILNEKIKNGEVISEIVNDDEIDDEEKIED